MRDTNIYLNSILSTMIAYITLLKPHNNLSKLQNILQSPTVDSENGALHMDIKELVCLNPAQSSLSILQHTFV